MPEQEIWKGEARNALNRKAFRATTLSLRLTAAGKNWVFAPGELRIPGNYTEWDMGGHIKRVISGDFGAIEPIKNVTKCDTILGFWSVTFWLNGTDGTRKGHVPKSARFISQSPLSLLT